MNIVVKPLLKDKGAWTLLVLLVLLSAWWAILQGIGYEETSTYRNLLWAASYQILAILGGIWGLVIANKWGGTRSIMGRSILAFALGLLLQAFGQSTFSFYNLFLKVDVPYPSIADIGFFGSIPFYVYGIVLLARASGVRLSLRSIGNKIQALLLPIVMLLMSYYLFLRGYDFEGASSLKIFLDFGYPIGQVVYVSIALLTYTLSRKVLGGIMRSRILFILFALLIQYIADSNFLYQTVGETWLNGGYGDMIYAVAYFLMGIGLLQLKAQYLRTDV